MTPRASQTQNTRPLTAAQRRLWTGQQLDPRSPHYNTAMAFAIDGPLDEERFRKAFDVVVRGADALRTSFETSGDEPRQHVAEANPRALRVAGFDGGDEALEQELARLANTPFALDGPLYESVLFRLAPQRYVWYFSQHHLITDFWSTSLLYQRMAAAYAGETLPDPPRYADLEADEPPPEAVAFWRDLARRNPPATPFYGRMAGKTAGRSRSVAIPFGPERSRALRALASRPALRAISADLSLLQLLATLLFAFVRRVGDIARPGLATIAHNRLSAQARQTAGLFVELFPLDIAVEDDDSFLSLASRVAEANRERLPHTRPGASPEPVGRDLVLNFMRGSFGDFGGLGVHARWLRPNALDPGCALRLHMFDFVGDGDFGLELDLNESVFGALEAGWAERDLLALADAMLADPQARLLDVALPSSQDRAGWLPRGPEQAAPALESLLRAGDGKPEAPAILDGDHTIAHCELWERVEALAQRLQAQGLGPGRIAGLLLPCSAELVIAILAVLETGAAYTLLDPSSPPQRLAAILDDAGAALLLTDQAREPAAELGRPTLLVGEQRQTPSAEPRRFDPASLAYVLYTSGSSGRPKGVEISRASLANYLSWAAGRYSDAGPVSFPLFTSPTFDLTVTSIFTPIVTGGAVVAHRGESANDPFLVRQVFQDDRADVVKLTPSHLSLIRDLPLEGVRARRLILGGEELSSDAARAVHERSGGRIEICNEYGPTEATVGCMIHVFDPAHEASSTPIGVPIANTQIDVMDHLGRPAPRGVLGEIVIRGAGVARGYRNLPAETHEKFRHGAYWTGDLGRWRADGVLEFHGREDLQIKWRGARIELGEIEAALASHPSVRSCAAALTRPPAQDARRCQRCGLESAHPEARLGADGVCAVCHCFEDQRRRVDSYFGTMDDLRAILSEAKSASGPHDCLMLYSGGKDSTYALSKLVEMGARPLVYHFDNGYISEESKVNVRRVVERLGLELVVGQTPAMDAIFADSLARFSNVCNGCFKAIYTLATNLARERGIRHIVTGLSRGQIFETRIADLYRRGIDDPERIDQQVLEARKAYHRMDDAVARLLDVSAFQDDAVFDQIRFVDFYRYCDDTLDQMLAHLHERTPWIRPADTGRSTNCRINDAGIFVHKAERGFHNYSMPYSWDVRLGHKRREAAVAELDDDIDASEVRRMLRGVGYREKPREGAGESRLAIYWSGEKGASTSELRRHLAARLPPEAVPAVFVQLDELPLTDRHKVDRRALPDVGPQRPLLEKAYVEPATAMERTLAEIWEQTLDVEPVGIEDDFFELGGDSIHAIQIVASLQQRGLALAPREIFEHPAIAALALRVGQAQSEEKTDRSSAASSQEWAEVLDELGG